MRVVAIVTAQQGRHRKEVSVMNRLGYNTLKELAIIIDKISDTALSDADIKEKYMVDDVWVDLLINLRKVKDSLSEFGL